MIPTSCHVQPHSEGDQRDAALEQQMDIYM